MSKLERLKQFSNPDEVYKRGKKLGVEVMVSKRKDKKYVIRHPVTNKLVNFGQWNAEDATFHKDPVRIANFRKRNAHWADAEPFTPAFLAYWILW